MPNGHPLYIYQIIIGDLLRSINIDIRQYAFDKKLVPREKWSHVISHFPVKNSAPQVLKVLEDIFKGPFDFEQVKPISELVLTVFVPKVDYVIHVESIFSEEPVMVGSELHLIFKIKISRPDPLEKMATVKDSNNGNTQFTYEILTDQNWVLSGKKKCRFTKDMDFQVTAIPIQTGRLKPPKLDITTRDTVKMEIDYQISHEFISVVSYGAVLL